MTLPIQDATIEVTGIRIRRLMVPLRRPLTVSFGTFKDAPMLAIELETKGGVPGRLLGFTFHRLGLTLLPPVLEHLATFAKGKPLSFNGIAAFHDACQKNLMLIGHEGVTQLALSMFDMVLHDALARAAGVPLYTLLGAAQVTLPAYNSCGGNLIAPAEAAREAQDLVAEHGGFKHLKIRLGRPALVDDLAAIRAVREAVGPSVALSVDFNQALPPHRAYDICRALDTLHLAWIEEPVTYDDYESQARLAAKLTTPLQIGETWWHWRVAARAMQMRACDYAMPDILRIGGVTGWLRTAQAAALNGVPLSSHLSPEFSAHVLAASPTRHWLEFMDWGQDLLEAPLVPDKGVVRPSDRPGAGIDFREAALAKLVVAG
jgi:mandelate racemase